ncbi:MAG TPA: uracil-DNA glycosylase family protein [Flavobacteriaceae bacterium]|nr:uracil-DNA glycosylase family protein [Flavobacteriaceae bacterium]
MFEHRHPYLPFIPENTKKLIVGTLPPPRFSQNQLKSDDVDFCYGSRDGQLWKILGEIFEKELLFEDTEKAVKQRKEFLIRNKLGICDMVESCQREKIDSSDLGMRNVKLRNMLQILRQHPSVGTLLFTGGNSKNGPEYFFRKHIQGTDIKLELVQAEVPRIHEFVLDGRKITTVSLTAPSGSANRAIGGMQLYKDLKKNHPEFTVVDFRVMQYKPFFLSD